MSDAPPPEPAANNAGAANDDASSAHDARAPLASLTAHAHAQARRFFGASAAALRDAGGRAAKHGRSLLARARTALDAKNVGAGARPSPRPGSAPPARRDFGPVLKEAFAVGVSTGLAGAIAAMFIAFVLLAPRVPQGADLWQANRELSVVILDRNGAEIAARGSRYGEAVTVADLPPTLVKAFLATEDRRFYDHGGVDLRGTFRAFVTNLREGGVREGGSTITQQLARNLFLTPEQTYIRKAREALLALWLEGHYSKDEILSLYLNRIYLGAGAYGIEAAARTYFDKSARNVTLAESVMLAGLPKAPARLAPTLNPLGAQNRANEVLDNLVEIGAITAFEAREARRSPPVIAAKKDGDDLGWLFDMIAAEARALTKGRRTDLIVTTTIDSKMQAAAETALRAGLTTEAKLLGAEQGALIAYDVDGSLRAMVGGRSYLESQFNRATQALRQPGSAFKPFVFVAGLESGLSPKSVFVDQPIDINGWKPANYKPGYAGRMRLTEAAAQSVNTIAVQVTERAGRGKVAEAARRLGVESKIEAVPSIALGGGNVTLDELTRAYIPFAAKGVRPAAHVIEQIEDQTMQVIWTRPKSPARAVLEPRVAEQVTHLLYQVMHSGTGRSANLGARVAAGKTGTTNDWRDAWFVGYTAQIVAGVWVGNDAFTPMNKVTGGTIPAKIWKQFMLAAHQDLPRASLPGAYPASSYQDEAAMIAFYTDMLRGLQGVMRDGNERRGARDDRWRDF